MIDWLGQLQTMLSASAAVMMITVIGTRGSVPRETGTRMLVTSGLQSGTIGGGRLEFSAIKLARDRLLANEVAPFRQKVLLGPALGQCCGGSVELLFETMNRDSELPGPSALWYCRRIDLSGAGPTILMNENNCPAKLAVAMGRSGEAGFFVADHAHETWACDRLLVNKPTVVVFGAGHVGAAVVEQLSLMMCDIIWIDERPELFTANLKPGVKVIESDSPVDEVRQMPDNAWFIVMTHSHATDFELCKEILQRPHFSFLGLIGSATKRNTFRKRLAQRGLNDKHIERMCCPIGIEGIRSNHPAAIALGLAAQLTMLWESRTQ